MARSAATQPATSAAGSTRRSARQQSKEPEAPTASTAPVTTDKPSNTRTRAGRHSRNSSTSSVVGLSSPANPAGNRKQPASRKQPTTALDAVPEQEDSDQVVFTDAEEELLPANDALVDGKDALADNAVDLEQPNQVAEAVGPTSNARLSGATAVEHSLTDGEIKELQAQGRQLVTQLESLEKAADHYLGAVCLKPGDPSSTHKAFRDKVERIATDKTTENYVVKVVDYPPFEYKQFANADGYIPVPQLVEHVFRDAVPRNILYKINTAILVKQILSLTPESPDFDSKLSALCRSFPLAFSAYEMASTTPPTAVADPKVLAKDLVFVTQLEVHTQAAINIIRRHANDMEEMRRLIDDLWHAPDNIPAYEYWCISAPNQPNSHSSEKRKNRVLLRKDTILLALDGGLESSQLGQQFPWSNFLAQLLVWMSDTKAQLDTSIAGDGGVQTITQRLKIRIGQMDGVDGTPTIFTPNSARAGKSSARKKPPHAQMHLSVARHRAKDKAEQAAQAEAIDDSTSKPKKKGVGRPRKNVIDSPAVDAAVEPMTDIEQDLIASGEQQIPPVDITDANIDPSLDSQNQGLQNMASEVMRMTEPTNRFPSLFNPQRDASKVALEGDMLSQVIDVSSLSLPHRGTADPNSSSNDTQPTPDGGYNTNANNVAKTQATSKRKATEQGARQTTRGNKRHQPIAPTADTPPPMGDDDNSGTYVEVPQIASPRRRSRPVAPKESTDAAPSDYIPPSTDYHSINQMAKHTQATHGRKPQAKRRPWSPRETDALIDYIETYGTSWSRIKEVDKNANWLIERSQVDLKDKARNMKMDYLKSGTALPGNFENIQLDKKAKDKLAALNIDYTQTPVRGPRRVNTDDD